MENLEGFLFVLSAYSSVEQSYFSHSLLLKERVTDLLFLYWLAGWPSV